MRNFAQKFYHNEKHRCMQTVMVIIVSVTSNLEIGFFPMRFLFYLATKLRHL
jgi:hypothetical protein